LSALAVDVDGPLPFLLADVFHQGVVHDPGAVDEHLHRTKLPGAPRQGKDLLTVRNVRRHDDALLTGVAFEAGLNVEEHVLAPGRKSDVGAFGAQCPRHGGADATRRPGHHGNPASEPPAVQNERNR
jgi:hypothetical protein